MTIVADRDRPLLIQKPPALEAAIVRQRLLLRHVVTEVTVGDEDRTSCRWEIASYIQRDVCFTSITGMTGCTASVSEKLAQESKGVLDIPPLPAADVEPPPTSAPPAVCEFTSGPLAGKLADAVARLSDRSAALFESDFNTQLRPLMTRTGATLKPR